MTAAEKRPPLFVNVAIGSEIYRHTVEGELEF